MFLLKRLHVFMTLALLTVHSHQFMFASALNLAQHRYLDHLKTKENVLIFYGLHFMVRNSVVSFVCLCMVMCNLYHKLLLNFLLSSTE